jgi:hypothetical protein
VADLATLKSLAALGNTLYLLKVRQLSHASNMMCCNPSIVTYLLCSSYCNPANGKSVRTGLGRHSTGRAMTPGAHGTAQRRGHRQPCRQRCPQRPSRPWLQLPTAAPGKETMTMTCLKRSLPFVPTRGIMLHVHMASIWRVTSTQWLSLPLVDQKPAIF